MRTVRIAACAALLAAGPLAAQTSETPCASVKTTALPPCSAAVPAGPVLGTLDGVPVAASDLEESLRARRAGLEAAVAEARRAALQAEIDATLLELEAARREMSLPALLEAEVDRKTPPPSSAAVEALFDKYKKRGSTKTLEEVKPMLERLVRAQDLKRVEAEFTKSLRVRFPVVPGADAGAAGLAKDIVLATVGARRITAGSAATRLDAAGFAVRRDLYYEEREALEGIAHDRLVKIEAEKRGVTPESLEKDKVKVEDGHTVKVLLDAPLPPTLALDLSRGSSRGDPGAAVTVVEWADFECPHCAVMFTVFEEVLKPYGDRVRYVYFNNPLPMHLFAEKAAEAALAARAQGKFFALAPILFRNQKALDPASLRRYAAEAGLDVTRFAADVDSGRFAADVLLEKREGERAGVLGTPFFFVNGVWLPWDKREAAELKAVLDAAFEKAAHQRAPR